MSEMGRKASVPPSFIGLTCVLQFKNLFLTLLDPFRGQLQIHPPLKPLDLNVTWTE